jgi:hypothetical protein
MQQPSPIAQLSKLIQSADPKCSDDDATRAAENLCGLAKVLIEAGIENGIIKGDD